MHKQLTVLVVDDSSQTRLLVGRFLEKLGHLPLFAETGEEAVALFNERAPDLVLLDVQMPGMGGYEAAQRMREQASARWAPIIFLSAAAEDEDKIKGLEIADDYLVKPVHFRLLEAKMKVMQRIADMQSRLRHGAEQLEQYRDDNEREQRLAKHLLDQIVRADIFEEDGVQSWVMPAQHFSGDLLLVARAPGGALHVMLADGTGHGLTAALSVLPVADVFYSMTGRGFVIASIARELNRKIKRLMPTGRFVAATMAAIDKKEHTIEIWNGGNPTALFVRHDGRILRSWPSAHPALGILGAEEFSDQTEVLHWVEGGQLLMCSDGLLEAENAEGEAFGEERIRRVLSSASLESGFGRIRTALSAHLNGQLAHDDISLLSVACPRSRRVTQVRKEEETDALSTPAPSTSVRWKKWRLGLRLSAGELRSIDILPFLMEWVNQVQIGQKHRGELFLILAELFNNALDHGVLGLDSALKADLTDGFEHYISERTLRLNALTDGYVEIEIEPIWQPGGELLQLRVKDSGAGFDYKNILASAEVMGAKGSGRGLSLLRDLCSYVAYLGNGNEVIAHYRLS